MVKRGGLVARLALIGATAIVVAGLSAAPASARVEVRADKPRAGATDVTLSFFAEARSRVAGIAFVRMVLPAGITADDLSLLSAPDGWRLSATPDGYNVGGPPLEIGESAAYRVNVARLPANTTRLAFRTVQTYSDGRIEPDNRLAVLILAPAQRQAPPRPAPSRPPAQVSRPPAAVPPPVESSAPAEVPPPVLPSLDPTFTLPAEPLPPLSEPAPSGSVAALATTGGRPGNALWIGLAIAVAILAPTGLVVWRRRRTRPRRAHARPGSRVAGRRAGHRAEATAHRRGVPLA